MSRYHRQTLLPQINPAGQAKLAAARVLLIGCGALGTTIADQLVRAGVGYLKIVDRDLVEWTNLQRQVLFDEADAAEGAPKAVAAARRLSRVNSSVVVEPVVADVDATNVEALAGLDAKDEGGRIKDDEDRAAASPSLSFILPPSSFDVILDGTDNAETRYLVKRRRRQAQRALGVRGVRGRRRAGDGCAGRAKRRVCGACSVSRRAPPNCPRATRWAYSARRRRSWARCRRWPPCNS